VRKAQRRTESIASRGPVRAFSLVEVILAVGIVSVAMLAIVGLSTSMIHQSKDNFDRRALVEASGALRFFLSEQTNAGFSNVFGWVADGGTKDFVYVTYRANDLGDPDRAGSNVLSQWFEADADDLSAYDAAQDGAWIRARIGYAPENNLSTNLTGSPSAFPEAHLVISAMMDTVPTATNPLPPKPRFKAHMGILR
jgi:type II secretory pathway pseudopilin PulG